MSWLDDMVGLPADTLAMPDFTGTVDTAINSAPASLSSASGLVDSLTSTVGKVADFGFNVQKQVLAGQAQSQNLQLQSLMQTLGFKTAQTQANTAATVAQYQAQAQIANAQKAAGVGTNAGLSLPMLVLGAGLIYLLAKKA